MELYQVKVIADVYADSNWDEMVPGKYESIKIISITNDRYKIKEEEDA